jgi:hypothetical protein
MRSIRIHFDVSVGSASANLIGFFNLSNGFSAVAFLAGVFVDSDSTLENLAYRKAFMAKALVALMRVKKVLYFLVCQTNRIDFFSAFMYLRPFFYSVLFKRVRQCINTSSFIIKL